MGDQPVLSRMLDDHTLLDWHVCVIRSPVYGVSSSAAARRSQGSATAGLLPYGVQHASTLI